MAELTPRQRLFVAEYLKDLNAKHAAVRTGYSGKSRANGNRLMVNEAVRAEIERALAPRLCRDGDFRRVRACRHCRHRVW
ncbi:terminase small subunit [Rhizobium sp. WYCCWR 11146]|uniref:terminase small subunit n=1 Tax=Rhizobium sp. WYCCWR 11146 TaxID=2749833 RepID=UPI0015E6FD0C|nr:terminase small subunit [Rhizobium sp. WYCCWR 11146]